MAAIFNIGPYYFSEIGFETKLGISLEGPLCVFFYADRKSKMVNRYID